MKKHTSIPKVAIIGAGQLGSRHLQGLKNIGREIQISVVDPNIQSIELSKGRFHEIPDNPNIRSIDYHQDISCLDETIDLVIAATNADVRADVIKKLMNHTNPEFLVLEKVAFQSIESFNEVRKILETNGIKTWVNCTRRMYPIYQEIKAELDADSLVHIHVIGKNWSLGCNAIHHIDLLSYLAGKAEIKLDASVLDNKIYQSKREQFVEFGGILKGRTSRGDSLTLIDRKEESGMEFFIQIISDTSDYHINELASKCCYSKRRSNWNVKEKEVRIPFQSNLTGQLAESIFDKGACELTGIDESYIHHEALIQTFNSHLNQITGKEYKACPIT